MTESIMAGVQLSCNFSRRDETGGIASQMLKAKNKQEIYSILNFRNKIYFVEYTRRLKSMPNTRTTNCINTDITTKSLHFICYMRKREIEAN